MCNISVFILDQHLINLAPTTTISENSRLNLIIPLYFKSLSTLTLSASITLWGLRSFHSSSLSSPSTRVSSQLLLSCLLLCSVHANFPHSHGDLFISRCTFNVMEPCTFVYLKKNFAKIGPQSVHLELAAKMRASVLGFRSASFSQKHLQHC